MRGLGSGERTRDASLVKNGERNNECRLSERWGKKGKNVVDHVKVILLPKRRSNPEMVTTTNPSIHSGYPSLSSPSSHHQSTKVT